MKTNDMYSVYYNDQVNEMALLATFAVFGDAKKYVEDHMKCVEIADEIYENETCMYACYEIYKGNAYAYIDEEGEMQFNDCIFMSKDFWVD